MLVISSGDTRFIELLKCFEIIFGVTEVEILSDYIKLRTLINDPYEEKISLLYKNDYENFLYTNWITVSAAEKRNCF